MKLYLAIDRPEGKRFRFLNRDATIDTKAGQFVLYPNEATEVPDELAERLLKQDGHLVSKKPLKGAASTPLSDRKPADGDGDKAAILADLADADFSTLKVAELRKYLKTLGVDAPKNAKQPELAALLDETCATVADAVE